MHTAEVPALRLFLIWSRNEKRCVSFAWPSAAVHYGPAAPVSGGIVDHLGIGRLLFFGMLLGSSKTALAEYLFTTIDVPGAIFGTFAKGINGNAQIVGFYINSTGDHGFLDTGGSLTTIDVPGATQTEAFGINDSGQIVGFYIDTNQVGHGFLAAPTVVPEPITVLLSAGCLIGLAVALRRLRA
jgi:hypothetical protein